VGRGSSPPLFFGLRGTGFSLCALPCVRQGQGPSRRGARGVISVADVYPDAGTGPGCAAVAQPDVRLSYFGRSVSLGAPFLLYVAQASACVPLLCGSQGRGLFTLLALTQEGRNEGRLPARKAVSVAHVYPDAGMGPTCPDVGRVTGRFHQD